MNERTALGSSDGKQAAGVKGLEHQLQLLKRSWWLPQPQGGH